MNSRDQKFSRLSNSYYYSVVFFNWKYSGFHKDVQKPERQEVIYNFHILLWFFCFGFGDTCFGLIFFWLWLETLALALVCFPFKNVGFISTFLSLSPIFLLCGWQWWVWLFSPFDLGVVNDSCTDYLYYLYITALYSWTITLPPTKNCGTLPTFPCFARGPWGKQLKIWKNIILSQSQYNVILFCISPKI